MERDHASPPPPVWIALLLMLATALNARAQCSQAITVDIHRTNSAVETRCYNAGAAIDLTGLSNFSAIDLIQV